MRLVSKKLQPSISWFQASPYLIPDPLWRVDGPENEINHQWLMIQPIYLFSEPVEEIHKTGLRELVCFWIQAADVRVLCSLGHRGWAQLPPPLHTHLFLFTALSYILYSYLGSVSKCFSYVQPQILLSCWFWRWGHGHPNFCHLITSMSDSGPYSWQLNWGWSWVFNLQNLH